VIVIIHFSEQVKFSKVRSPATYLPHPKLMFASLDIHRCGKWFQSNFVACSRYGNGYTNSGNVRTATALWLQNNGNVMLETRRHSTNCCAR